MAHILIFIHWFVLVFTFGNVELVTIDNSKSNDFPIEELNGYTLREVFENNNLITVDSLIISTSIISGTFIQNITLNNNDVVYYSYFQDTNLISNIRNTPRFDGVVNQTLSTSENYRLLSAQYSQKVTMNSDKTSISHWGHTLNPIPVEYHNFILLNMDALNISSLTVEQMDYWFNIYQENEQREINDTYDYIENELTTNDLIYIVLFALLWGLAIKIVKGVM